MKVSEQLAEGIAEIAVEGGSNYWATVSRVKDQRGKQQWAVREQEPSTGSVKQGLVITRETMQLGVDRISGNANPRGKAFRINGDLFAAVMRACKEDDACELDADSADAIVQAALFGELVYG